MAAPRKKTLLASRRRRQDDGEEEESVLGDFEDDSLSEGSAVSNGDDEAEGEGSDSSGDEHDPAKERLETTKRATRRQHQERDPVVSIESTSKSNGAFRASADTEAMLHGLGRAETSQEAEAIHHDDLGTSNDAVALQPDAEMMAPNAAPNGPRHETPAQRSRREHQEYIRQRNANPAFVPTRGGFFLHDDRNSTSVVPGSRPFARGRGRGHGAPVYAGRGMGFHEPTDKPWAHDLHEDHETASKLEPPLVNSNPAVHDPEEKQLEKPSSSTAPNRSFSFTTVLGNVNVQVSLPGMDQKISVPNVVKKHHTLLPQHRPPLRRDKPVRVSIPDTAPRYIFPSTDRSFIFIPRALRPNQQGYSRGRGRPSWNRSRQPSIYGSVYTPSIAMSRKSSLGASTMRDGLRSPADSVMSRVMAPGVEGTRPVIRMPSAVPTPSLSRTGMPVSNGQMGMTAPASYMQPPAMYASHSTAIPIHQPRPQKTVSVADIESPASFQYKAPQPQQEQPFHQQVPAHFSNSYGEEKAPQPGNPNMPGLAGATPLSQIPEGAVFTQGFQPSFPVMGAPTYFGPPFTNGAVFYPPMTDGGSFGVPINGPALAPSFVPGSQSHPVGYMPATGPVEGGNQGNMVAHESNGMVYYYNPAMFATDAQGGMPNYPMAPSASMMGMANGMPTQAPFYYSSAPSGMFYPAQSS